MEVENLPYNRTLGLKADGDRICLSPKDQHLNHVGTVHATVIFGIAEAASGSVLLYRFPELSDTYVALLRESSVKFRRPANSDADILGTGTIKDNRWQIPCDSGISRPRDHRDRCFRYPKRN